MFPLKDNIPLARFPIVTVVLVAINVIAYLLEIRHGGSFFGGPSNGVDVHYGAIPYELTHPGKHCDLATVHPSSGQPFQSLLCAGQRGVLGNPTNQPPTWATVFTSMFLHGSFLHILGNMVFLAIFGPTVEDSMSRPRYLGFYLLGGLIALGAQVAVNPGSTGPTLGASGAIAAVLGGYILLYPRARVISLIFIVFFVTILEVPAIFLLGFWFLEQLYFALTGLAGAGGIGSSGEGVAYFAHIGGFIFGLLAIRLLAAQRGNRRGRPPLPVY
jgi:membrane associated rhomboid family serine protease